eukprot:1056644-Rhodomonas_salina.2
MRLFPRPLWFCSEKAGRRTATGSSNSRNEDTTKKVCCAHTNQHLAKIGETYALERGSDDSGFVNLGVSRHVRCPGWFGGKEDCVWFLRGASPVQTTMGLWALVLENSTVSSASLEVTCTASAQAINLY